MKKKSPVLIVGCSRSGTTLLSALVESHLHVAVPIDTMAIPIFYPYLFLWGNLENIRNRKRLISAMHDFIESWVRFASRGGHPEKMIEMSIAPELKRLSLSSPDTITSYQLLIDEIYSLYALRFEKELCADHSTTVHSITGWDKSIPGMKVVHIIRDGRDVCLSWVKEWFGAASVVDAAVRWKKHITVLRNWGMNNPDRYIEVYYEDLVSDARTGLERISAFIGSEYNEKENIRVNGHLADAHFGQGYHHLLRGAVVKNNTGKWKTKMTVFKQELFEVCAADMLRACNYPVPQRPFSLRRYVLIRLSFMFYFFGRFFSLKYYQYWLRTLIPAIVWCAHALRINIAFHIKTDKKQLPQ